MTQLDEFRQRESKLAKLVGLEERLASPEATSEDKLNYRAMATGFTREVQNGLMTITADTPDPSVQQVYVAAKQHYNDIAGGYFGQNKGGIIREIGDDKIVKNFDNIPHPEIEGDERRKSIIKLMKKYNDISKINEAYDSKQPLNTSAGPKKIEDEDLVGFAAEFLTREIDAYYAKEGDAQFVTEQTRNNVKNASLSVLQSTPKVARLVTEQIESKLKREYETELPENARAAFARDSLMNIREDAARQVVYGITN